MFSALTCSDRQCGLVFMCWYGAIQAGLTWGQFSAEGVPVCVPPLENSHFQYILGADLFYDTACKDTCGLEPCCEL